MAFRYFSFKRPSPLHPRRKCMSKLSLPKRSARTPGSDSGVGSSEYEFTPQKGKQEWEWFTIEDSSTDSDTYIQTSTESADSSKLRSTENSSTELVDMLMRQSMVRSPQITPRKASKGPKSQSISTKGAARKSNTAKPSAIQSPKRLTGKSTQSPVRPTMLPTDSTYSPTTTPTTSYKGHSNLTKTSARRSAKRQTSQPIQSPIRPTMLTTASINNNITPTKSHANLSIQSAKCLTRLPTPSAKSPLSQSTDSSRSKSFRRRANESTDLIGTPRTSTKLLTTGRTTKNSRRKLDLSPTKQPTRNLSTTTRSVRHTMQSAQSQKQFAGSSIKQSPEVLPLKLSQNLKRSSKNTKKSTESSGHTHIESAKSLKSSSNENSSVELVDMLLKQATECSLQNASKKITNKSTRRATQSSIGESSQSLSNQSTRFTRSSIQETSSPNKRPTRCLRQSTRNSTLSSGQSLTQQTQRSLKESIHCSTELTLNSCEYVEGLQREVSLNSQTNQNPSQSTQSSRQSVHSPRKLTRHLIQTTIQSSESPTRQSSDIETESTQSSVNSIKSPSQSSPRESLYSPSSLSNPSTARNSTPTFNEFSNPSQVEQSTQCLTTENLRRSTRISAQQSIQRSKQLTQRLIRQPVRCLKTQWISQEALSPVHSVQRLSQIKSPGEMIQCLKPASPKSSHSDPSPKNTLTLNRRITRSSSKQLSERQDEITQSPEKHSSHLNTDILQKQSIKGSAPKLMQSCCLERLNYSLTPSPKSPGKSSQSSSLCVDYHSTQNSIQSSQNPNEWIITPQKSAKSLTSPRKSSQNSPLYVDYQSTQHSMQSMRSSRKPKKRSTRSTRRTSENPPLYIDTEPGLPDDQSTQTLEKRTHQSPTSQFDAKSFYCNATQSTENATKYTSKSSQSSAPYADTQSSLADSSSIVTVETYENDADLSWHPSESQNYTDTQDDCLESTVVKQKAQRKMLSALDIAKEYINAGEDPNWVREEYINKVKGRGLVAATDINKGQFLVEYCGELISGEEGERRETTSDSVFRFFFTSKNKAYCLDGTQEDGRLCRLANHGERHERNAKMTLIHHNGAPKLCLFSICDMKAGDEVLYDYGIQSSQMPWKRSDSSTRPLQSAKDHHSFFKLLSLAPVRQDEENPDVANRKMTDLSFAMFSPLRTPQPSARSSQITPQDSSDGDTTESEANVINVIAKANKIVKKSDSSDTDSDEDDSDSTDSEICVPSSIKSTDTPMKQSLAALANDASSKAAMYEYASDSDFDLAQRPSSARKTHDVSESEQSEIFNITPEKQKSPKKKSHAEANSSKLQRFTKDSNEKEIESLPITGKNVDDNEWFLIQVPIDYDVSMLTNQAHIDTSKRKQYLAEDNSYESIQSTWQLRTHKCPPEKPSKECLVVQNDDGSIGIGSQLTGHMTVYKEMVLPKYELPPLPPRCNVPMPEGLRQRYVPFGADGPKNYKLQGDYVVDHGMESLATSPRKRKASESKIKAKSPKKKAKESQEIPMETEPSVVDDADSSSHKKKKKKDRNNKDEIKKEEEATEREPTPKRSLFNTDDQGKVDSSENIDLPNKSHKKKKKKDKKREKESEIKKVENDNVKLESSVEEEILENGDSSHKKNKKKKKKKSKTQDD